MNSVITDMYRRKASCASVGNDSVKETVAGPVVSTSSGLSYCIDRTGVEPFHKEADEQQQSRVTLSDPLTTDDMKTSTTTHREAVTDDVIVIEDSRERNVNLNAGINVSEHSSTAEVDKHCSAERKYAVTDLHLSSQSKKA